MSEGYWDGALWVYHADITNGAGGAGTHSYTIVPGAGNEMEVLYGHIINGDTSTRTATIVIDDGTNILTRLMTLGLTAASAVSFPTIDEVAVNAVVSAGPRFIVAGTMRLLATVTAVAASQDTVFSVVARIRGAVPTVTEAGASTPTININTERVF